MNKTTDIIPLDLARTLPGAFRERVRRNPDATAYIQYDSKHSVWNHYSWQQTADNTARFQTAMRKEGLQPGDRVSIMTGNCSEWVMFDQAALGLGLVTVPLYTNDRPENVGYILEDAGVSLLMIEGSEQWHLLCDVIKPQLNNLKRIVSFEHIEESTELPLLALEYWLTDEHCELQALEGDPEELATIVYTSGTTGQPKGVMLSHTNILWDAAAGLSMIDVYPDDLALSFLPLSHTLERTAGYYLMILAGGCVAFNRSIPQLGEDLQEIKPTILISVPRIFERVYAKIKAKLENDPAPVRWLFNTATSVGWDNFEYQQGRISWSPKLLFWPLLKKLVASKVQAKLGGRLRFAISGGAALTPDIARLFIGLGIPIQQGYGLTEFSPVISVNKLDDNLPFSVGTPLTGVETAIGEQDELLVRGPALMLGYWNNPQETQRVIDEQGWLHTGDQARIEDRHIFITGRLKEIIVMANGEKVSPADMEMAIALDSLFEQVLVVGEGKPYLSALVVPNPDELSHFCHENGLSDDPAVCAINKEFHHAVLERMRRLLHAFPGYAEIRKVAVVQEPWSIENEMMTPTMKLKRNKVINRYSDIITKLYAGH